MRQKERDGGSGVLVGMMEGKYVGRTLSSGCQWWLPGRVLGRPGGAGDLTLDAEGGLALLLAFLARGLNLVHYVRM